MNTRPRGLAPWRPQKRALQTVENVKLVLDQYAAYVPLTIRQIFYRLVAQHLIDKTDNDYKRLSGYCNRARRAGMLPFDVIRDDGVTEIAGIFQSGPDDVLRYVHNLPKRFALDPQANQPVHQMVICESAGMVPMLANEIAWRGVPTISTGGFDSVTFKHDLAQRIATRCNVVVHHIGDHDPGGVAIATALQDDLRAFVRDLEASTFLHFNRVAVRPDQIETLNLPTAPRKAGDRRQFQGETVQCEAIDPATLTGLLDDAVSSFWSDDDYSDLQTRETQAREQLQTAFALLPLSF